MRPTTTPSTTPLTRWRAWSPTSGITRTRVSSQPPRAASLMIAFSILGLTIEVLRPDLAEALLEAIEARLQTVNGAKQIAETLVNTLTNWRGVLFVALLSA